MKPLLVFVFASLANLANAVPFGSPGLPIGLAPHEQALRLPPAPPGTPPVGPIRSLGEWEESASAITLWSNASFVKALAERGPLTLLADNASEVNNWKNWLKDNQIDTKGVRFFSVNTDSMWIRDYGPWYILDGAGKLGMVDTIYNRPRPNDDKVPAFLAQQLNLPIYSPGLVHTGGNYYADGLHDAYSSTLVFRENSSLTEKDVLTRMLQFLGIERYVTSRLSPGSTIEHLDTFGKLVAPDTWVFSEFPDGASYKTDSEAMVAKLRTLKSPYGTPFKIFRMKMVARSEGSRDYRAYINSFISNKTLYFPTYGGPADEEAKRVYQAALPGYEIVGVDGEGTGWGDSVHCRANNLYRQDALHLFPELKESAQIGKATPVRVEAYPAPGAVMNQSPVIHWTLNGIPQPDIATTPAEGRFFAGELPAQAAAAKIRFYVEGEDSLGHRKTAPIRAPEMTIDLEVQ